MAEAARTPTPYPQITCNPESSAKVAHYWSQSAWISCRYFSKEKKVYLAYCEVIKKHTTTSETASVSSSHPLPHHPVSHRLITNRRQLFASANSVGAFSTCSHAELQTVNILFPLHHSHSLNSSTQRWILFFSTP